MPGGGDSQLGWATETTVGTFVTPTKFMPFVSENIKATPEYMDTKTLSARRTLRKSVRGITVPTGPFSTELPNTTLATFLKHVFGTVATTGAGPYTHTYTPGTLTGKALSVQVGRPDSAGVVQPFSYAGMKVASWEIGATVGEIANLSGTFIGMTETTATGLATASYDASWTPFTFLHGAVTVTGASVATVKGVTVGSDNMLPARVRFSGNKEPLEAGVRTYAGTLTTDFDSLTHYNLVVNGTETAMVLTFNNTAGQTLTMTMNVQFVGETPNVGGFDLVEMSLPYRCVSGTSDANAITAVLVNTEINAT